MVMGHASPLRFRELDKFPSVPWTDHAREKAIPPLGTLARFNGFFEREAVKAAIIKTKTDNEIFNPDTGK
jgi:hypothetical protein